MIKRIFSVFVLTVFLAHFAGFYIYFIFQLNKNRQEMRARLRELPADQLELITLSWDEFLAAKEEEHEIEVDGKMYDIARVERKGNMILVYCLHDKAEDSILTFLDTILTSPLGDEQIPASMMQFFSLNYITVCWDFMIPDFLIDQPFTVYLDAQSLFSKQEMSPPPWS